MYCLIADAGNWAEDLKENAINIVKWNLGGDPHLFALQGEVMAEGWGWDRGNVRDMCK